MSSIGRTLCWEFWRENRVWLLGVVGTLCILRLLEHAGDEPSRPREDVTALVFFLLLFMEMLIIGFFLLKTQYNGRNQRLGFPAHLYTKPVPTFHLVIWRLTLALLSSMVLHGALTLTFMLPWSMGVPMLLVGLTIVWVHALMWLFPNIRGLQALCGGVVLAPLIGLGYWEKDFYETTVADLMRLVPLPAILGALAGAYAVGWFAVFLDRRNVSLNPSHLFSGLRGFPVAGFLADARPQTPFKTLFMFEMRSKGWQWPIGFAAPFVTLLAFWLLDVISIENFAHSVLLTAWVGMLVTTLLLGLVIGKRGGGDLKIESYEAAKPITNGELLRVYLLVGLTTLALTIGALLGGPLLFSLVLLVAGHNDILVAFWEPIQKIFRGFSGTDDFGYTCFGLSLMLWTFLTLSATLMLTGRRWFAITVGLSILLGPSLLQKILYEGLPRSLHITGINVLASILGLVCLTVSFVAYCQAFRRALVSKCLVVAAGGLYGVLVTITLLSTDGDLFARLILLAYLSLPLLPIAAAPLALDWNRHR